ncbi:Autophagy protein 22 [Chytriomyces hyalinus]|nr:Autophagy protein 22 [Chytriomyces hyalinus]
MSSPDNMASTNELLVADGGDTLLAHQDIDGSPVTTTELRTWYLFGAALDAVSYCCVSVFAPVVVQSLAANYGATSADHTVPCNATAIDYKCDVRVGSMWIDTSSFVFACIVIAAVMQIVLFVAVGAVADTGGWRKSLLLTFGSLAGLVAMLFPTVTRTDQFWLAAVYFIIMNIFASGAWVFLYAFLPILARNHVDYLTAAQNTSISGESLHFKLDQVTNRISTHSYIWMYSATILTLIVMVVIFTFYTPAGGLPASYSVHVGILFAGVILMVGVGYALRFMRERPGPPFPPGSSAVTYSLKRVGAALSNGRQLKHLFLFLMGWFMVSDAFNTLVSVAVLLSTQLLGFTTKEVLIISLEAPLLAIPGAYLWNQFQVRARCTTKFILLCQTCVYGTMCFLISIGISQQVGFGWKHTAEVYVYAGMHGFMLGAIQSTCRSLFVSLLPPGHEGSFYSLYLLTDKGSSWIGPLIVAAINGSGADKRYSFLFLAVQFSVGLVFFSLVDPSVGHVEGRKFAREQARKVNESFAVSV